MPLLESCHLAEAHDGEEQGKEGECRLLRAGARIPLCANSSPVFFVVASRTTGAQDVRRCALLTRGSVWQPPKDEAGEEDDEESEEVSRGVAGVSIGGGGTAAAPFSFTPAPKGQSPFGGGGGAASIFSFPGGAGGATAGEQKPNFSFDFAAQPKADNKEDEKEGEEDDDDEEDDEDPVEEFIKSLPEPVQKCVGALDTLDEEICELETQFRKDLRDLERKVCACAPLALARCAACAATSVWCP